MDDKLLGKYVSGDASDSERQQVVNWIYEDDSHMREYLKQRRLYDYSLWGAEMPKDEKKTNPNMKVVFGGKAFLSFLKVAAVVTLVFLVCYQWLSGNAGKNDTSLASEQTIYVPAGQRAELTLADGTKVWLNSCSKLVFPSNFAGKTRNVTLDGEGFFAVAKNKKKPFIVETKAYNIEVTGTKFNVIAYSNDSIWETALLEGGVNLFKKSDDGSSHVMRPGTKLSLKNDILTRSEIDDLEYYRWREGLICFSNISIQQLFKKFENYFDVKFIVRNKSVLSSRFSGKFRTSDGVDHAMKVLKLKQKFSYTRIEENNIIIIE